MMRAQTDCNSVGRRIAAYCEGWLSPGEREEVAQHLAACRACAAEFRRDKDLAAALAVVPRVSCSTPAWADVLAAHQRIVPARALRNPRKLAWGGAVAIVLAGVLMLQRPMFQHGGLRTAPSVPRGPALVSTGAPLRAHALLAAVSVGGDANRAVLLAYSLGDHEEPR